MRLIVFIFVMFILVACTSDPILNENHSPVKLQDNGDFIYDFKYSDGCVGDAVKQCALKSMQEKNLVPPSCNNVKILKGGKTENGWAWATFRCES